VKIKFYKLYLVFNSNSAISNVRHSTENQESLVKLRANGRLLPHTDCGKTRYVWLSAINLQTWSWHNVWKTR